MIKKALALFLFVAALLAAIPVQAGLFGPSPVTISAVSQYKSLKPGTTQYLGVLFHIEKDWHIYWQNPGETGVATEIAWTCPQGFSMESSLWPIPDRSKLSGITSLGYSGDILIPVRVKVPDNAKKGSLYKFKVSATWLACSDTCLPGDGKAEISLPIGEANEQSEHFQLFSRTLEKVPQNNLDLAAKAFLYKENQNQIEIVFSLPNNMAESLKNNGSKAEFYPQKGSYTDFGKEQILKQYNNSNNNNNINNQSENTFTLSVPLTENKELPNTIEGVIVSPKIWSVNVKVPLERNISKPKDSLPLSDSGNGENSGFSSSFVNSTFTAIIFAFFGGIILNLMPCVFPVLSLKILSFVEHKSEDKNAPIKQALYFTLGVLFSFWAIAGLLILLRSMGEELGWGFQLQSSKFVIIMSYFFMGIALNLFGVFEVGLSFTRIKGMPAESALSSFFSGVIATLVATPCSAPFMGSAIGFSLTQPLWSSFLVFTFLALGMACPYIVFSAWPFLIKSLPKPGQWMETLKQFLAFPLLLTCVYFIWVIDVQLGSMGTAMVLCGMVFLAMGLWVYGRWGFDNSTYIKAYIFSALLIATSLLFGYYGSETFKSSAVASENINNKTSISENVIPWTKGIQDQALREGKAVFIDFGASWCLTCQVNEKAVLESASVKEAFAKNNILLLKADWTNKVPEITQALASYKRSGVPLYVYYPAKDPNKPSKLDQPEYVLLPEILTPDIVIDTIKTNTSK